MRSKSLTSCGVIAPDLRAWPSRKQAHRPARRAGCAAGPECRPRWPTGPPGVELFIIAELALRDGPGQQRSRGASVREEGAVLERLVFGLIVHVLAAGSGGEQEQKAGESACPTLPQAQNN